MNVETGRRPDVMRGRRDGWKRLRESSDRWMRDWCEQSRGGREGELEAVVNIWGDSYERVVKQAVGWRGGGRRKKKMTVYDEEIDRLKKEMREIQREMMVKTGERKAEVEKERREKRREKQKAVRVCRNRIKMKKMREI